MPPVAAALTALFFVAVPAILLMAVWAGVTALQILFPDDALPSGPSARRRRTARGEAVPVRLRDILEDERARRSVEAAAPAEGRMGPSANPLFDDLWLRRN